MAQVVQKDPSFLTASKRTYAGGQDDSDLTVQNVKRITKKESANHEVDPEEEDYDQGDATSGFGE